MRTDYSINTKVLSTHDYYLFPHLYSNRSVENVFLSIIAQVLPVLAAGAFMPILWTTGATLLHQWKRLGCFPGGFCLLATSRPHYGYDFSGVRRSSEQLAGSSSLTGEVWTAWKSGLKVYLIPFLSYRSSCEDKHERYPSTLNNIYFIIHFGDLS